VHINQARNTSPQVADPSYLFTYLKKTQVTGRALLTDWEAYSDERTHRSREVSTMTGLSTFISPNVTIDAGDAIQDDSARASFGWDFSQWGRVSDEDVAAMAAVRDGDFNRLYPQRVVIVDSISYFGRLLSENPLYSPGLTKSFGSNPFPAAASMILRPSETPASLAGGYYLQKFAGRRIVAVHLRTIEYMSPEEVPSLFPCPASMATSHSEGSRSRPTFIANQAITHHPSPITHH